MGERDDARHQVEQTRARMTAVAHEVSRRMTPRYAKERATEMVRDRAMQTRDRAVDNPWLVPLLGAGVGALVGRAFVSRAQNAREREWEQRGRRWYPGARRGSAYGAEDYGYETYGEAWRDEEARSAGFTESGELAGGEEGRGMRDRGSDAASDVKERVADTKDRVADTAAEVKERVSEKVGEYGQRMREGAQHLRERIPDAQQLRERAQDQPGLWALGAMALGALFGFAVPFSDRERRALEPAREKAREAGEQALDKAMSRAESAVGEGERRREQPRAETGAPSSGATLGTPIEPRHDPLH